MPRRKTELAVDGVMQDVKFPICGASTRGCEA